MFLKKKNDRHCELHSCKNKLKENPAKIRVGIEGSDDDDYIEIAVCEECELLLETLEAKSQELFNESL